MKNRVASITMVSIISAIFALFLFVCIGTLVEFNFGDILTTFEIFSALIIGVAVLVFDFLFWLKGNRITTVVSQIISFGGMLVVTLFHFLRYIDGINILSLYPPYAVLIIDGAILLTFIASFIFYRIKYIFDYVLIVLFAVYIVGVAIAIEVASFESFMLLSAVVIFLIDTISRLCSFYISTRVQIKE